MYKIGALLAMLSGLFQILAGSLSLAHTGDLGIDWITGVGRDVYAIVIIILGAIAFLLGIKAWKKPRGLSSIILLAIFTANATLLLINGWTNATMLTSLMINIIGAITVLFGIITGKKNA